MITLGPFPQARRTLQKPVRKAFFGPAPEHPELDRLLDQTRGERITDAQLEEQRMN